jgi:osmotically inducible protein OsmC
MSAATCRLSNDGRAHSDDQKLNVSLSTPKELGGAAKQALPADTSVSGEVGIGPNGNGGFGLKVHLTITLPGLERSVAESLVAKAHEVCPYSNATRGNIEVSLTLAA